MRSISAKVSDDLFEKIEELCSSTGCNRSDLIIRSLNAYFDMLSIGAHISIPFSAYPDAQTQYTSDDGNSEHLGNQQHTLNSSISASMYSGDQLLTLIKEKELIS